MCRGLNNVLQDLNAAGDHPSLMTLWFNPSLFTILRKMFQSLCSDTCDLCWPQRWLVTSLLHTHHMFRTITVYDICFMYIMSSKSKWIICFPPYQSQSVFLHQYFFILIMFLQDIATFTGEKSCLRHLLVFKVW